ncbi:hypothetical protein SZN_05357 [Streptomyces zinciresistens K42]|uniref:Large ribosomal subunit protein bL12 C-terminal domain-containing protein n=1 Tax=Streptomyces zinciresistens K42 TaxID=700597 RepID=G2G6G4_9ACTN|nr:hypothetical protein SZN_05357 [Streptomyces zinciresistens K42]
MVGVAAAVLARLALVDRRAARVERKLDLVLDHLGLRDGDPRLPEVRALLHDGRKVEAVRLYREITGAGLKEAKDAVDAME